MTQTSLSPRSPAEPAAPRRDCTSLLVFAVALVVLLTVKWPTLGEVPAWDSAMGLFPAATTLADSGFDILSLIEEPSYAAGGPNVHSLSPITWITALVLRFVGEGQAALITMHIFHLLVAAAAAAAIFRLSAILYGKRLALLSTAAAFAFPLVLTQTGFLYLEIPMLAATTFALLAWIDRRPVVAGVWVTVAILIKGSGLIVVGTLVLAVLFDPRRELRTPIRAAALLIAPAVVFLTNLAISTSVPGGLTTTGADFKANLSSMGAFLTAVPDLLLLVAGFIVAAAIGKRRGGAGERQDLIRLSIVMLTVSFFGFYLVFAAFGTAPLPRYYTQIAPFLLVGLVDIGRGYLRAPLVAGVLLLAISFFVVNRNGIFYGEVSNNNFAVVERSGEYVDLLALHQEGAQAIEELGAKEPVFYPLPYHYFVSHPAMGYVDATPAFGRSILHSEPFNGGRLDDYPESFAMLYEFSWLGGGIIKSVWDQAEADPNRVVTVVQLGSSPFESAVIQVDTVGADSPTS